MKNLRYIILYSILLIVPELVLAKSCKMFLGETKDIMSYVFEHSNLSFQISLEINDHKRSLIDSNGEFYGDRYSTSSFRTSYNNLDDFANNPDHVEVAAFSLQYSPPRMGSNSHFGSVFGTEAFELGPDDLDHVGIVGNQLEIEVVTPDARAKGLHRSNGVVLETIKISLETGRITWLRKRSEDMNATSDTVQGIASEFVGKLFKQAFKNIPNLVAAKVQNLYGTWTFPESFGQSNQNQD